MSIILDALKKADRDKDQSPKNAPGKDGIFSPVTDKSRDRRSLVILVPAFAVSLVILSLVIYKNYFQKKVVPGLGAQAPATGAAPVVQENPLTIRQNAINYFRFEDYEKSALQWRRLIGLDDTDAEAHNNLGLAHKKLRRFAEAEAAYTKALEINPDYAEAHNNLGSLLLIQKKLTLAIQHLNRALEIKPQYAEAHFHRGLARERARSYAGAIEDYETFLQLTEDLDPRVRGQIEMRVAGMKAQTTQ